MLVIKIGGGADIDYESICKNLANLKEKFVLVHGGNAELNELSTSLGHPPKTIKSPSGHQSRRTDSLTMDHFMMAYAGKINKRLVELCQSLGVNAVGLSGVDGKLLLGERKKAIQSLENDKRMLIRDDFSGKLTGVNINLLNLLLDAGYVPVICPPAISSENEAINVDGDRAAALIASSLSADSLIILSNVPGLLKDVNDESSLIENININDPLAEDVALGRMKKKVLGAQEAISAGVKEVIFADARIDNPVDAAINGGGTHIHG